MLVFLGLVIVAIYCLVMQWLKPIVNNATMMFLTVGTINHLQTHGDIGQMFEALALGCIYFAGIILALKGVAKLVGKRKNRG